VPRLGGVAGIQLGLSILILDSPPPLAGENDNGKEWENDKGKEWGRNNGMSWYFVTIYSTQISLSDQISLSLLNSSLKRSRPAVTL